MPTFLADPPPTVYAILILGVIIVGGVWLRYQSWRTAIPAILVVLLAVVVWVIDLSAESPREQCVRRVKAMADAVNARRPDDLTAHVSDSFAYRGWKKGNLVATHTWDSIRTHDVRVAVWDFARDDVIAGQDNFTVGFMTKGGASGRELPFYIRARFTREPSGEWRLQTFAAYDPLQKANGPEVSIPGLP